MNRILFAVIFSFIAIGLFSQVKSPEVKKASEITKNDVKVKFNGGQDELMFNITFDNLIAGGNDSAYKSSVFNPNLGMYFLYDIPFGNTGLSFAPGIGFTFSKTNLSNSILFQDSLGTSFVDSKNHPWFNGSSRTYDGSSFYTSWIEVPMELRYHSKPINGRSAIKVAAGLRVGYKLAANSKINYIDNLRRTDVTNIDKPYSDVAALRYGLTFRIGYGALNLFGYYGLNQFFKDSKNTSKQDLRQYSIGISITAM
jgi:hypothetical protein